MRSTPIAPHASFLFKDKLYFVFIKRVISFPCTRAELIDELKGMDSGFVASKHHLKMLRDKLQPGLDYWVNSKGGYTYLNDTILARNLEDLRPDGKHKAVIIEVVQG